MATAAPSHTLPHALASRTRSHPTCRRQAVLARFSSSLSRIHPPLPPPLPPPLCAVARSVRSASLLPVHPRSLTSDRVGTSRGLRCSLGGMRSSPPGTDRTVSAASCSAQPRPSVLLLFLLLLLRRCCCAYVTVIPRGIASHHVTVTGAVTGAVTGTVEPTQAGYPLSVSPAAARCVLQHAGALETERRCARELQHLLHRHTHIHTHTASTRYYNVTGAAGTVTINMRSLTLVELMEEEEAVMSELRRQLEDEGLSPEEQMVLLNEALNSECAAEEGGVLNSAAVQTDSRALTRVKTQFYHSGVLSHCVRVLSLSPSRLRGNWTSAATLAHLTSSCCVGAEPGSRSEAFHRLFLPSVVDVLLSLAAQLMSRSEAPPLHKTVMDAVGWLLSAHPHLTAQGLLTSSAPEMLSSAHYEQIQMSDDVTVSLLCIQMWIQTCTVNRDFLSQLSDESALLLLNDAVAQLALSSDAAVGGASVRLMLLMANQLGLRLRSLLFNFKGLDSLLEKDWRGRGFEQEVDQLIAVIRQEETASRQSEESSERVRAACVIQAAWRSVLTRRRVKSLSRAVSTLQRRYRARRRRLQQQEVAQQWEEQLRYQVCVRRQQARRRLHQKQRELLQLLPAVSADQVRPYLEECERRAAVVIQSAWRGFRDRRLYGDALRDAARRQRAARTLQRAVRHKHDDVISPVQLLLLMKHTLLLQGRRLLEKRPVAQTPPQTPLWIGQEGLTDSRRAELKQQVEEYIQTHRSTRVSVEACAALHEEVQQLLQVELQGGAQRRREEQQVEALLAQTHTHLELLRDAPPLSVVTAAQAESFLSPSASIAARGRNAHNATLQASRLPWWRTLGDTNTGAESGPAYLPDLEAELGGLFIGGLMVDGVSL
ncbi:hypothetical protein CCH79_00017285 [Gambusia affinis]|uniref:IQ motif containing B1 n=1 Tax=Gambusia affinis TaxID=33528 RepID=A0A315WCK6_GAMAF|nr:hypothetical protein CCH79_00017285 [Gambusia affinis]